MQKQVLRLSFFARSHHPLPRICNPELQSRLTAETRGHIVQMNVLHYWGAFLMRAYRVYMCWVRRRSSQTRRVLKVLCQLLRTWQRPSQSRCCRPSLHAQTVSMRRQAGGAAAPVGTSAHSALRTDRVDDQAVGKINRRAEQGTGKNGRFAKHCLSMRGNAQSLFNATNMLPRISTGGEPLSFTRMPVCSNQEGSLDRARLVHMFWVRRRRPQTYSFGLVLC